MQFDVEKFKIKAVNPYTQQEEEIIGGAFCRILRHEILGFNPKGEDLLVKHSNLNPVAEVAGPPSVGLHLMSWMLQQPFSPLHLL